ncbi:MAG: AI-2E family transporter [Candidatus Nomurabacteria bacterium]|nr:AI-2E family transporter [Candidatus Nomurabacteria bacterium]
MQSKIIERYFFFILLFVTFIFSFLIFRPFWVVLVLGVSFSIVFSPVYEWLNKRLSNWLSALLTVLLFIIIIGGLLFGISIILLNQSQSVYNMFANTGDTSPFIDSINNSINKILPSGISFNLYEKITNVISVITNNIASVFTSTLSTLFSLFLTFLSMFFFLKDNKVWKRAIKILSPLSDTDDEKIINKLSLAVNGIIKGYLFVVIIQGTLVSIGFAIFGVPNPALWGLVAMVTALVPTIGSGLVSIPAIIFLVATGHTMSALGLLVWAVAMVGTIDNILNPVIVGSKINLPPLIILFSVLGGISLLGPVGILVGPLTISLLYTLISIYRNEFQHSSS